MDDILHKKIDCSFEYDSFYRKFIVKPDMEYIKKEIKAFQIERKKIYQQWKRKDENYMQNM